MRGLAKCKVSTGRMKRGGGGLHSKAEKEPHDWQRDHGRMRCGCQQHSDGGCCLKQLAPRPPRAGQEAMRGHGRRDILSSE